MPSTTTMTIEMLAQRVEALEKQMTALTASQEPVKKEKKNKKEKKSESDGEEKPKSKRISGYILYSNANREEVKQIITDAAEKSGDKPKNTEVMKKLAEMWKSLTDEERGEWNAKAKELKEE
jgi:hypothetical protein